MIICCGEALIDMVRTPVPGTGDSFLPLPGGSPYNTAIAIGRLGVPVKFLGRFSTDFFGEILVKRLRDNRVGDELVIRSFQNTSLAFVKLEKNKDPQYVFYTEGTADRSLKTEDLPPKLPADTRCILFGSISMTMEPIASAIEALILREGTRKSADQMDGAPILSFDPNIRPFMIKDRAAYIERFEKWIAASTIAKISAGDFEFIYPKLEAEKSLQKILAMGPRLAICTLGTKGALALLRRNDGSVTRVNIPAVSLPVVDTIGAGDAFHGAFLAWLEMKGKMSRSALVNLTETELAESLFFANKAASIVCSRRGAEPPTKREIDSLKIPEGKASKALAAKKSAAQKAAAEKPASKKPAAKASGSAAKSEKSQGAKKSAEKPKAVSGKKK
ncbi:MAG: carbohydrate kinase [Treponema sp.]|nr:carbohydrate kinase [Treponema sp.]